MSKVDNELLAHHYNAYQQELCAYAISKYRLCAAEAEDVVQQTFERFANSSQANKIRNVRAFLYKTVGNACIDQIRRNQVRENHIRSNLRGDEQELDNLGPERQTLGRQFLDLINTTLFAMPSKRRRLLVLNRVDGLSYAEIARRENLSETVVRKHVAKALAACQQAVREKTE